MKYLLNILNVRSEEIDNCKEKIICSLIVLPHLVLDMSTMNSEIKAIISRLIVEVLRGFPTSLSAVLLLLHQAMSTIYLIFGKTELEINHETLLNALSPLIKTHLMSLQVLDIYCNSLSFSVTGEYLDTLRTGLVGNLASPFHQVRLLTLVFVLDT